jgi:hypothetical protein
MRKGPLSKADKEFIDANRSNMTLVELASKLQRSDKVVETYLKTLTPTTDTNNVGSDINLYARNKERGVVVMTESASMSADEKKTKLDVYSSRKYRDVIHKIRED